MTFLTQKAVSQEIEDALEANEAIDLNVKSNREILSRISFNRNSEECDLSIDVSSLLEKDQK